MLHYAERRRSVGQSMCFFQSGLQHTYMENYILLLVNNSPKLYKNIYSYQCST